MIKQVLKSTKYYTCRTKFTWHRKIRHEEWSKWESDPRASKLYWGLVPKNQQEWVSLSSSTMLDIIKVKAVSLQYLGAFQRICFESTDEFIYYLDMHLAPFKLLLYLNEILFFQVE